MFRDAQERSDAMINIRRKNMFYSLRNSLNQIFHREHRSEYQVLVSTSQVMKFVASDSYLANRISEKFVETGDRAQ